MSEKFFFEGKDISLVDVAEGVSRKIVAHGGDMMIVEVHFKKGAVGYLHEHFHEQVSYCIKGKFEFEVSGQKHIIGAGDSVYMPKDSLHGCQALEDSVLLDIFTPQREDFK